MKCLCCGWEGETTETCPKCGEASWEHLANLGNGPFLELSLVPAVPVDHEVPVYTDEDFQRDIAIAVADGSADDLN